MDKQGSSRNMPQGLDDTPSVQSATWVSFQSMTFYEGAILVHRLIIQDKLPRLETWEELLRRMWLSNTLD